MRCCRLLLYQYENINMLASCSTSSSVAWSGPLTCSCPRPAARCMPGRLAPIHATNDRNADTKPSSSAMVSEDEARIEALENQLKKAKPQKAGRQIPVRNMTAKRQDSSVSPRAEWKEGKLFPEGWEQMDAFDKITELYLGQRGLLFWANKVAYASVFVIIGAWILFRFVGPALGLYKLDGDFAPPPV